MTCFGRVAWACLGLRLVSFSGLRTAGAELGCPGAYGPWVLLMVDLWVWGVKFPRTGRALIYAGLTGRWSGGWGWGAPSLCFSTSPQAHNTRTLGAEKWVGAEA